MPGKIDIYKLGTGGVNLTKGSLHLADTEVERAQNAEVVMDNEEGGQAFLAKRGGYVTLNDTPLDAAIVEMVEVKFIDGVEATNPFVLDPASDVDDTPVDNGAAVSSLVGGTDYFAVMADTDDDTYFQVETPGDNGADYTDGPIIQLETTTDPNVLTGHKVVIRALVSHSHANFGFEFRLGTLANPSIVVKQLFGAGTPPVVAGVLTDYEFELDGVSEVQELINNGWFAEPRVSFLGVGGQNGSVGTATVRIVKVFYEFEG